MFAGCLKGDGINAMFAMAGRSFEALICFVSLTGSVHKGPKREEKE